MKDKLIEYKVVAKTVRYDKLTFEKQVFYKSLAVRPTKLQVTESLRNSITPRVNTHRRVYLITGC